MTSKLAPTEAKPADDKRFAIGAKLRHALDLMVWGDKEGNSLDWDEAGRAMNISARSMRKSLERPAVRTYLREQKQVFRACISAKSLSRLDELAAQRTNMNAAVAALKVIEDGDVASTASSNERPGVTIHIVNAVAVAPAAVSSAPVRPAFDLPVIDVKASPAGPRRDAAGFLIDDAGERVFEARRDY